jgi:hypothetical protein
MSRGSHGFYSVGQVCKNGHAINGCFDTSPEFNEKFCTQCGAETINQCPSCSASIRGRYHVPGYLDTNAYRPPKFCHECGSAYPWTTKKQEALLEIIEQSKDLLAEDKTFLKDAVPDLVTDTAKSESAAHKFKIVLEKLKGDSKDILIESLKAGITQASLKLLGLG